MKSFKFGDTVICIKDAECIGYSDNRAPMIKKGTVDKIFDIGNPMIWFASTGYGRGAYDPNCFMLLCEWEQLQTPKINESYEIF